MVKTAWPAIVSVDTFQKAQTFLDEADLVQGQRLSKKITHVFLGTRMLNIARHVAEALRRSGYIDTIEENTYDDDFIHFSKALHSGIFQEALQFYESGLSLAQVAGRLKKSKTFIRSTLIAGGVSLRPSTHTPDGKAARNQSRMAGPAPYGFTYLRGQLVVHPGEVEQLLRILELWNQGHGPRAFFGN